jgi:ribosomal protein S18 acetylase RimI-like enzyme
MNDELVLRAARPEDFGFCERTYFEPLHELIKEMGLDEVRRRTSFASRWLLDQVRMILLRDQVVGWVQTATADDAVFVVQLFVDATYQRRGIGTRIMETLIEEAAREDKAITLGVGKTNPAQRLYRRLGFETTHQDERKFYMRRADDRASA